MKRTISILLLLGALLSAGCVRNDDGIYSEVEFSTVVKGSSRAIVLDSTYPETVPFKVNAYYSENANFVVSQEFMNEIEISKQSDGKWRNANRYYWPLSGAMKFFAYSPATLLSSASSVDINSLNGVDVAGYRISESNLDSDFMYATVTVDDITKRTFGSPVPLSFSHALTQIRFTAQLAAQYSNGSNNVVVSINSITLNNIFSTGNFRQNPMGWRDQSGLQTYAVVSGASVPIQYVGALETPITVGNAVLMIPQTMSATASMTVIFTVEQTGSDGQRYSDQVTVKVPINTTWLVNRKVTYNLKIKLDDIEFVVTDGEWDSASGGEIVI